MRTVAKAALVTLAVSAAVAFTNPDGHLALTKSAPEKGAAVPSPVEIRLWFNQEIQLSVSRIDVQRGEQPLEIGKVQQTDDPKSFKAVVLESLNGGSYVVQWRSAGPDGHVIRGRYEFTVAGEVE